MRIAMLLVFGFSLTALSAQQKADFVVTAKEYDKAYQTDATAFTAKYKNKRVEMSGVVWGTNPSRGIVFLDGHSENMRSLRPDTACTLPEKLQEQVRGLARGQEVTFRGKAVEAQPYLVECELVKIGPSPATPVTVTGLFAEFEKDEKAATKKYHDKPVVVRVKIAEVKSVGAEIRWIVTDPSGKGPKLDAMPDDPSGEAYRKELKQLKEGDTVILLGNVFAVIDTPLLREVTPLKEPPPGVKLPGDRK